MLDIHPVELGQRFIHGQPPTCNVRCQDETLWEFLPSSAQALGDCGDAKASLVTTSGHDADATSSCVGFNMKRGKTIAGH